MTGCNNCKYGKYDHNTGFYNCLKENNLTSKDIDDLTDTGGANCSQFELFTDIDYIPSKEPYKPLSPEELEEILQDLYN